MKLKIINLKVFDVLLLIILVLAVLFLYQKPCTEIIIIEGKEFNNSIIYDIKTQKYYLNNISFDYQACKFKVNT